MNIDKKYDINQLILSNKRMRKTYIAIPRFRLKRLLLITMHAFIKRIMEWTVMNSGCGVT